MADLHNLLGELDEPDEPSILVEDATEQEENEEQEQPHNEAGDDDIRGRPEVPPALVEAERKRFQTVPQDENDETSFGGGEFDLGKKTGKDMPDGEGNDLDDDDDVDYAQLKKLWKQESNCPELMEHDTDTVGLFMELLEGQEESIDKLLDQAGGRGGKDLNLSSLVASIYKMDADRVRFMLTDLSRTRLAKIEQHALYMRGMVDRMSEQEVSYLKQYGELLERHLRRSVLDHLPKDAWKKLDEPEMIDSPDLDEFIFCQVLETVEIDNRDLQADQEDDEVGGDSIQEHQAGACLIARYSVIKDLVSEGKIELIM